MGVVIGQDTSGATSTWGSLRGVIYNTTTGLSLIASHNLVATDAFTPTDGGLFRSACWPYYTTSGSNFAISGAFAFATNNGTTGYFSVKGYNYDGSVDTYAPHNMDDQEIQSYWVGRDVTLDSGVEVMTYDALDGTTANYQTVSNTATDVVSFDL